VCLQLVGVQRGDEVLIPALTFVATANAVTFCGAIPHFIDCEERTLGIDSAKMEAYLSDVTEIRSDGCYNRLTGRRVKAVVPMHTFGHPVDIDPLIEVCRRYHLEMVEDAAESLGSFYKGRHTGTFGRCSAVSFNGNKTITTGGGGAIITDDEELGRLAKHLTTTAKIPHRWEIAHDKVGYNYRMPNINAALGCAQLEQLQNYLDQKRALAQRYNTVFSDISGVHFFEEAVFAKSNYWLNTLVLDTSLSSCRDEILDKTNSVGITTRPAWVPLHKLAIYENCPQMKLLVTDSLAQRIINIPSSPYL
jgi:perosamine synthetase